MATGDRNQQDRLLRLEHDDEDGAEEEDEASSMSWVEHLEELRRRLFKSLLAIGVGSVLAFIFRQQTTRLLTVPLPKQAEALRDGKLVVTGIAEGLTVFLLISLAAGVILPLPVILYQIWAFVAPGLYEREKKYAVPSLVSALCCLSSG